jgi:hypothetical protein
MSISLKLKNLINPFLSQSETRPTEVEVKSLEDFLLNREKAVSLARNFGAPNGGTSEIKAVVHQLNELLQTESINGFDVDVKSINPDEEFFIKTQNPIKEAVATFITNLVNYMKSPEAILRKITGDYSDKSKPIYQLVA